MSCSTLSSSRDSSSPIRLPSFWIPLSHDLNAPSISLLTRRSLENVASWHRARTGMDDSKKDLTFNVCAELAIMSRAEPSRAEPSRAEPSRAEPSRAEPSGGSCLSAPAPPDYSAAPYGARNRDRSRWPAATVLVVGLLLLGAAAAEAQLAPSNLTATLEKDVLQLWPAAGLVA